MSATADDCLDPNDVAALLSNALPPEHLTRLDEHLDRCAACRALVAGVADMTSDEAARAAGSSPAADATAVRTGDEVDHFRVLRPIGHGGMADVYLAKDTKLGRTVALKMVRRALLGSEEAIARFHREARATARLRHPGIVSIFAIGEHQGSPYVALEYLEGETLRDRLRGGPLHPSEAVRVALAIAEALRAAHGEGVLHRDLKPENVHLARDGRVRVLDFGLAKLMEAGLEAPLPPAGADERISIRDPFLTSASKIAGTPGYMAPEQWRGEPCSDKTDVWALGVILFTLLTGKRPFPADTSWGVAMAVTGPEPAPSVLGIDPSLSRALSDLVAGCLAKAPPERPALARVIAELQAWVDSAVVARPVTASFHPSAATARQRWPRGLTALAYLAVFATAVSVVVLLTRGDALRASDVGNATAEISSQPTSPPAAVPASTGEEEATPLPAPSTPPATHRAPSVARTARVNASSAPTTAATAASSRDALFGTRE